jgi:pimeloyl-ACP methyl ester carboxylesterase
LAGEVSGALLADGVERAMDEAGFETAHLVGNSLGGYVALQLAERGRARSVLAFAPAGGWAPDDPAMGETLDYFVAMQRGVKVLAGQADAIVATAEGRRNATRFIVGNEYARMSGYGRLRSRPRADHLSGPGRLGHGRPVARLALDRRPLPRGVVPGAEWVELDSVGHCPQLDVPLEAVHLILDFTAA